jgi:hypothetical protein
MLGGVRYGDKNVGSGLLNKAEAGHQEGRVALIQPDVRLGRSVGGEAKRRAHNVRYGLGLGFPNGLGGVLATVVFMKTFVRLCSAPHKPTYVVLQIMLRSGVNSAY